MADVQPDDPVRGLACLRLAYREALEAGVLAVSFWLLVGLVLVLTAVGPIGIEVRLGPLERLGFWSTCCALCWPPCHALTAAILYAMRARPPLLVLLAAAVGALFLTVPCTAVTYTVYGLFVPPDAESASFPQIYLNVAVLVLACSGLVHYVLCERVKLRYASEGESGPFGAATDTPGPAETEATPTLASFFGRLPRILGRDVVYATVSGHYLNVVTTAGSCLVLMRMSDAVAALGDLGMQVHRSHWVAYRHVTGVVQDGQRTIVRVTGLHELPVSRTHVAKVRDAVRARRA